MNKAKAQQGVAVALSPLHAHSGGAAGWDQWRDCRRLVQYIFSASILKAVMHWQLHCSVLQSSWSTATAFLLSHLFSYCYLRLIWKSNCPVGLQGCLEERWSWLAGLGERAAGHVSGQRGGDPACLLQVPCFEGLEGPLTPRRGALIPPTSQELRWDTGAVVRQWRRPVVLTSERGAVGAFRRAALAVPWGRALRRLRVGSGWPQECLTVPRFPTQSLLVWVWGANETVLS